MNHSEFEQAINEVLAVQSEQEMASVLVRNPALLEQETIETLMAIARKAKQDGDDELSEALEIAFAKILRFTKSQVKSAKSQSSQSIQKIEPKVAWAIKARRYIALRKKELLDESLTCAKKMAKGSFFGLTANPIDKEIVQFLVAFADYDSEVVERLTEQLIPKLQQSERLEESLSLNLLYHDIRAGLVRSYFRYPIEQQKQMRELGIQACEKAIQIAQILNDKLCQAFYSNALGIGLAETRRLREAEYFLLEALQITRELASQEPHIFNQYVAARLNNLANVQSEMKNLVDAENSYLEALQLYRYLAGQKPHVFNKDVAMTLSNLGLVQSEMRKLIDAETSFQEALKSYQDLAPKKTHTFDQEVAMTLENFGNMQSEMGKFADAEKSYIEALELYQYLAGKEPHRFNKDVAQTLNRLGIVQWSLRKFADAKTSYQEALKIRRELAKKMPHIFNPEVAMTLNNLSTVQSEMRKFADAEISCIEALELYQYLAGQEPSIFNQRKVAGTLNNVGRVQSEMRKFADAEISFQKALKIYQDLIPEDPNILNQEVAMTLNNLGSVQSEMRKFVDAETSFRKALKIRRELAKKEPHIFSQEVAKTLSNLGYLQLKQDKLNEAKENFESARGLIEDLRAKAITIDDRNRILQENTRVYSNLLDCYIRLKDWKKALEIAELGKSRSLSDLLNLKSEDLQPKASTSDTLAIVKDLGQQYSDAIKELQQIESYERYLSEQLNRFENDIKRIIDDNENDDDTRQDFLRQIGEQKQPLEQEKQKAQDRRFAVQTELKSVLEEINKYDKDFPPKAKDINAESIFEISKNLKRTIVMFRILRESTAVIFVFPTGELHIEEIKGFGQNEMFELFRDKWLIPYLQWKDEVVGLGVWRNAMEQMLDTIYEKLLIHVHQVLNEKSDSTEVLFVPNQSLALLPLHAASWKDEAGRKHYLLEEYSISYAPSVSVFKRCQENEKQRSNKTLFVTNPTEDLDSSEKEVLFIEGLHQPSKNLLRKDATKSAVVEALREDYGFAHFSCHGFYNQANPFDSGLVMSDEVIKLSEIINSNLQSNWLTTLSACETGMVDFGSPTDEHFGLPLGFIFAGSPSVWASLWSVSDMATSELMKMAYKNLSQEEYKDNKPEALRQAQLEMLKEGYPHPFFWAGFQHFGV